MENTKPVKKRGHLNQVFAKATANLIASPVGAFFLDPVLPKLLGFYLHQYLDSWKKSGLIKNYEVEIQKIGRLHYKVCLHALAGKKEAKVTVVNYLSDRIENLLLK